MVSEEEREVPHEVVAVSEAAKEVLDSEETVVADSEEIQEADSEEAEEAIELT